MIFLANENFPYPSIRVLRENGFEILSIGESFGGMSDEKVLQKAVSEKRIILTFDRDYGELIYKYKLEAPPAVVYFRTKGPDPIYAGRLLLELIQTNSLDLEGYFTVLDENGIRQRRL